MLTELLIEGSTVAVFGCGAIGLGVIATSALVKASRVIAVDTNPKKESWAKKFGATDFVNPTELPEGKKIQEHLVEITDGGLDYTFDCTGNVSCQQRDIGMETDLSNSVGPRYARSTGSVPQRMGHQYCHWRRGCWPGDLYSPVSIQLQNSFQDIVDAHNFFRFQLVTGRTWRGSAFGGVKGRTEIPGLVKGKSNWLFD